VIGYNFFKLSYLPFSEWTVIFPVLVSLIAGVAYTASGQLSMLAIYVGVVHALMNIPFFLTSRAMDVDADRAAGKITTLVKYPGVDWQAVVVCISLTVAGSVFFLCGMPYNVISVLFAAGIVCSFVATVELTPVVTPGAYSIRRKRQIYISITHSIVLAVTLLVLGGAG
jgi:UbiA prenyltransferase family.